MGSSGGRMWLREFETCLVWGAIKLTFTCRRPHPGFERFGVRPTIWVQLFSIC